MRVNLSVGIVAMTDPTINPNFPVSSPHVWNLSNIIIDILELQLEHEHQK